MEPNDWGVETECCARGDGDQPNRAESNAPAMAARLHFMRSMKCLSILLVMWPLAAHAGEPCANDHYMHAFDPALGHMACSPLTPIAFAPGRTATVLHAGINSHATREEAAAINELGELAAHALSAAGSVHMPMPEKITFFLDTNEIPAENRSTQLTELEAARNDHFARPGECVLAYHYRSADPRKKFIVAHQLFHCITMATWDDARLGAGDADWWAEGSAEFFASIVFPGTMTDVDAQAFHANESASLFSRSADAVVFFDWYATQAGRLKGVLDTVHDKAPGSLMVELKDDVGSNWLDFEEKYFDHTIQSPGGAIVQYPNTPAPETTRITGSTSKPFTADPYAIHGAILEFAEGHAYEIDGGADDDFKWKWSEGDAGTWSAPPAIVHTCHQLRRYRLVLAAKDRRVTKRLRVTAREEHESDCPCVVGAWQQTASSLAGIVQRLQARGIRNSSCSLIGGGTLIQFTADHNGGETYQDLHTSCRGTTMTSDGRSHGTRSFTWAQDSPTQMTFTSSGGDAVTHISVSVRGHNTDQDVPMTAAGAGTMSYRCTRTDLHLELRTGSNVDTFDYTRAH